VAQAQPFGRGDGPREMSSVPYHRQGPTDAPVGQPEDCRDAL